MNMEKERQHKQHFESLVNRESQTSPKRSDDIFMNCCQTAQASNSAVCLAEITGLSSSLTRLKDERDPHASRIHHNTPSAVLLW